MEKIIIKNCNNIDNWVITIKKDSLNLKYWINWTGKSTIAKAIQYTIDSDKNIEDLTPFKYIWEDYWNPEVSWLDSFKKITIFNEEYVNEFTFKKDEILKDSFEIFIKDEKYKEWIKKINIFINDLKIYFEENSELELFISDLNNLVNYWKLSKKWKIWAAGILSKWLEKWNLIENIPSELSMYSDYLKNTERITWLWWQSTWEKFHDISSNKCPYCVSDIETKTEAINKVSEIYDKTKIDHLNKVIEVMNNLMKYFSEDTNEKIKAIINNTWELIDDQIEYLEKIILESKQIFDKLSNLKKLNFHDLKEIKKEDIESQISNLKIDLKYFPYFDLNILMNKLI